MAKANWLRSGALRRFNDGRFRVTTEAQLRVFARFVFPVHWPLEAWGVGTTAVNRRQPPPLPRQAGSPSPEQMNRKMSRFVEVVRGFHRQNALSELSEDRSLGSDFSCVSIICTNEP